MDFKQYLLTCFIEESVEVAHAASKVIRFTPDDSYVQGGPSNLDNLCKEFNELLALRDMLIEHGINISQDTRIQQMKRDRVMEYAKYSQMLGVIEDVSNN
jgi:hypothetical protein